MSEQSSETTWYERVGCICKPGDGSVECPRVDECMAAWHEDQRYERLRKAAEGVVTWAEDARKVFADELIEGAIVLRPETFYALRDLVADKETRS